MDLESFQVDRMKLVELLDDKIYAFYDIQLSDIVLKHNRRIYSLLDLFGDLGGLLEILSIIVALFCNSWAEF